MFRILHLMLSWNKIYEVCNHISIQFCCVLLTISWWRSLSYRNQSNDLLSKSVNWFLCDRDLYHESFKTLPNIKSGTFLQPLHLFPSLYYVCNTTQSHSPDYVLQKQTFLKKMTKFKEKHLKWSPFFSNVANLKVLHGSRFPVNLKRIFSLQSRLLQNISMWLLVNKQTNKKIDIVFPILILYS